MADASKNQTSFADFFSRSPHSVNSTLKMTLDLVAIFAQVSAFIVWPIVEGKTILYLIPISLIFISFGWWENFLSEKSPVKFISNMAASRKVFKNKTYFIYTILAPWKCIVFLVTTITIVILREGDAQFMFKEFSNAFKSHSISVVEVTSFFCLSCIDQVNEVYLFLDWSEPSGAKHEFRGCCRKWIWYSGRDISLDPLECVDAQHNVHLRMLRIWKIRL